VSGRTENTGGRIECATDRAARESRDREKPVAVVALTRLGGQADQGGAHEVRDLTGHLGTMRSHEMTDEVLRIAVPPARGLPGRSVVRAGALDDQAALGFVIARVKLRCHLEQFGQASVVADFGPARPAQPVAFSVAPHRLPVAFLGSRRPRGLVLLGNRATGISSRHLLIPEATALRQGGASPSSEDRPVN